MNIVDNKVILREFNNSDIKPLAELCNNKKIWDNLRDFIPNPYNEEDAKNFIKMCQNEKTQFTFAIEYNGDFVGSIGLIRQSDVYKFSAEVGYWVGEPFWGKGIATHALEEICKYGFNVLGLARIYAGVFEYNKASQKVLEKCRFKFECIFEKSVYKNYQIYNEYRYALINDKFSKSTEV